MCIPTDRFNCTMYMYYFNFMVNDTWRFIDWKKKTPIINRCEYSCADRRIKKKMEHFFINLLSFVFFDTSIKTKIIIFISKIKKTNYYSCMILTRLWRHLHFKNCLGHDILILTAEMHQHQFGYSEVENQLCVKICIKG